METLTVRKPLNEGICPLRVVRLALMRDEGIERRPCVLGDLAALADRRFMNLVAVLVARYQVSVRLVVSDRLVPKSERTHHVLNDFAQRVLGLEVYSRVDSRIDRVA